MTFLTSSLYYSLRQLACPVLENPSKPILSAPDFPPSNYDAWLASRTIPLSGGDFLSPGAHREITLKNLKLAYVISKTSTYSFASLLWNLHPFRLTLMMFINVLRGVLPAFRGYSQAMIIDEIQSLVSSGQFTLSRLAFLLATEAFRMVLETSLDTYATYNENVVQNSTRFLMEYKQLEQRVRMDVPTLADPVVRDLFHESDLFVRSFHGMSSFGLLSPFELIHILTLVTELISNVFILWTLTFGASHHWLLVLSLASTVLPLILPWMTRPRAYFDDIYSPQEARSAAKQEKMRALAHSDPYRPEVILFGLGPWILQTWANARKSMLGLESESLGPESSFISNILSTVNIGGILTAVQNIPLILVMQTTSASLGSFTLYRSTIQCLIFSARNLTNTVKMAFQGIFLLGAFSAAMEIEPKLQPPVEKAMKYCPSPNGMKLEARNLTYYYPGCKEAALKNVNFTLEAGESLAIVGMNGSGKSTLANILLRIIDFHEGELLINGQDISRYNPEEYHQHVTAVFQGFSKFNASAKENIGVGYVPEIRCRESIENAAHLAGAGHLIGSLPKGLKTTLDSSSFHPSSCAGDAFANKSFSGGHHGLSGGEWQRIAISRAFMRAHRPEVELLVFDEPTSSLDAHAQNRVFDTVESLSRSQCGKRVKTVVFITHRLSTTRRADKIAMMEQGTITEFGTHEELLQKGGSYASLYNASV